MTVQKGQDEVEKDQTWEAHNLTEQCGASVSLSSQLPNLCHFLNNRKDLKFLSVSEDLSTSWSWCACQTKIRQHLIVLRLQSVSKRMCTGLELISGPSEHLNAANVNFLAFLRPVQTI